jgi:hypothetical protein
MCSNCYHSKGRDKKAWNCPHQEEVLYARGMCQKCYQTTYNGEKVKLILILRSRNIVQIISCEYII